MASELAKALLLPHAQYELGTYNDSLPCVLSPNFVPKGCSLIHGNELLGRVFPLDGSRVSRFHQTTHTIDGVFDALQQSDCEMPLNWDPPKDLTTAYEVFTGYLLLDALIGNTDRHHENWGILQEPDESMARRHLAPTYDHAACLGFNLQDAAKAARLSSNDSGFQVEAYAEKALSALYANQSDSKPLTTIGAFQLAANRHSRATEAWMSSLQRLGEDRFQAILLEVPQQRLSAESSKFALRMLLHNRKRLLNLA